MRIDEILTEEQIDEIDRRGFLRGLGAAGAAAALPGLASAKSTASNEELIAISKKIRSIFAKNIVITGPVPVPTAPGRFRFTFDMQGKLLNKEKLESTGDEKLDQAVLNSATNITPDIIALFKPEPDAKSVFINITVKDPWWKVGMQNGQSTQTQGQQNQSPVTVLQKFANNILKQRPNSTISKFEYQIYTDGVSIITAKGNFGNEENFAFISPTGNFDPKGIASLGPLKELKIPNHLIFGGNGYTQIVRMHANGEIKAEKDFYFDNDKKVVTDTPSIKKSQEGKGVQRFDNYVIFSGYSADEIKDQLIEKVMSKDKDTQVDDSGRVLTLKMHNPEGKNFGMAAYKALFGPRYSNMDVIIKFIFSSKGELVKVMPQAVINITNAFGRTETTPMNANEALDSLERLF